MTWEQILVFVVLLGALVLFVWGRWRYDVVAMMALLVVTLAGVVPADQAFLGFGHPAVVTVAAVLVISRALQNSGLITSLARQMSRVGNNLLMQIFALSALVAFLSAFMNNVGALALLMPVAIRMATQSGRSAGSLLMPLAFGSLLGGMTTVIGTPPNLIIAAFRTDVAGVPFRMFDFAPVGAGVVLAGVAYLALFAWRLLPRPKSGQARGDLYRMADYMTEVRIPDGSDLIGREVRHVGALGKDVQVVTLLRGKVRRPQPSPYTQLRQDDVLLIEAGVDDLSSIADGKRLKHVTDEKIDPKILRSEDIEVTEAVVSAVSPIVSQSAMSLRLRQRFGVNLLAVSRQGQRIKTRLADIRFRAGDVLLLQGPASGMPDVISTLGCLPLAQRKVEVGRQGQLTRMLLTGGLFAVALALTTARIVPIQVSLATAALLMVLLRLVSLRDVYESIEWPVLILLAALIPVGLALESTGGAALMAQGLLGVADAWPAVVTLAVVGVFTMALSNVVNNAAAALLTAPIAIRIAQGVDANPDAFLMMVAIGASAAFMTPIGHQSNTLVMGPGGYRFGDYWKVGLPLQIIVIAVAVPLIILYWGL